MYLRELIDSNNTRCINAGKLQFLLLLVGKHPPTGYQAKAKKYLSMPQLSEIQRQNAQLNLELIEFEEVRATNMAESGHASPSPSTDNELF